MTGSDPTLDERVAALERVIVTAAQQAADQERLTLGVERLANETVGLNSILNRVDEQQQRLAQFGRRVQDVEEKAATKEDVEEKVRESAVARRKQLRRIYGAAAATVVIALAGVIGGAWLTDAHLQACLINGPNSVSEKRFCDVTFPGHEHFQDRSIAAILRERTEDVREGCERDNERVRINISQTKGILGLAGGVQTPLTAELEREIVAFEKLLVDCEKEFPFTDETGVK